MARLFVDHREIDPPLYPPNSLVELIRHVESNGLPPERLVRQFVIDGIQLDPFDADPIPKVFAGGSPGPERIDIVTGTIPEIVREAAREALAYLDRVEALTPSLAASFHCNPGPQAFAGLRQLYDGFFWLSQMLDRTKRLYQSLGDRFRCAEIGEAAHYLALATTLQKLVRAQENEDFSSIADLLISEIPLFLPEMRRLFHSLLEFAA